MNKKILIIAGGILLALLVVMFFSKDKSGPNPPMSSVQVAGSEPESAVQSISDLYTLAENLKKDGELLKAKEVYKVILSEHSDYENIQKVQQEFEKLNLTILFSNIPTDKTVMHDVVSGDTLGEIAKKYGTTIELIKISNNLKSDVIRIGQKLRVWTAKFNIHVDKSQNVLLLKEREEVIKVYNVSTGSNSSTPIGEYTITTKLVDPVWFNKGVVLPPESPQNVLGTRWLGFDLPGYGIHGTVEPETIGQQVTAGCVRMRNAEVEELYSIVPMGTKVVVVN